MPTFPPRRPSERRPAAAPRRSPALLLGLILLTSAGCAGADEPTQEPLEETVAASPTPAPAEPTVIEGEALDSNAEGAALRAVEGQAPRAAPEPDVEALSALDALPVKGRAPKTGYDREEFGSAWLDVDDNGCDTRNDMLNRDLVDKTHRPGTDGCIVLTGTLDPGPYTGTVIGFVRGVATSSDVQIDHVVALSDAWQKGAQQLDENTRVLFANDPLNLLAVDGPTNQAKGDKDAASWLPPNKGFRCEYVARQIAVKAKYELWVTQAEKDAMARVLSDCSGQTLPEDAGIVAGADDALVVVPPPVVEEPAVAAPAPAPAPVQPFDNCSQALDAGVSNILSTDPRYAAHLDSEGDGIACESAGGAPAPAAPAPALVAPAAPAPVAPYPNCSAVRAAGAAPIYAGQPGFQPRLDGNGDGVGCE